MIAKILCSSKFCCAAVANNEVTYFAVVYVTFPVTCAILADIDSVSGCQGAAVSTVKIFKSPCLVFGETNGGLAVVFLDTSTIQWPTKNAIYHSVSSRNTNGLHFQPKWVPW